MFKKIAITLLILFGSPFCMAEEWKSSVTPYLWLPNIEGKLIVDLPAVGDGVSVGPNDYLENLDMAMMLSGETRNGEWSVMADLIYLDFSKESSRDISNNVVKSSLTGTLLNLAGGYTIIQDTQHQMDVIFGGRLFSVEVEGSGGVIGSWSKDKDLLDAIVGVHGEYRLNDKWSMPYHFDIGSGDSDLTWQASVSAGYKFGWGDFLAGYRHLEYDQGSRDLLQNFSFSGPIFGARFNF